MRFGCAPLSDLFGIWQESGASVADIVIKLQRQTSKLFIQAGA